MMNTYKLSLDQFVTGGALRILGPEESALTTGPELLSNSSLAVKGLSSGPKSWVQVPSVPPRKEGSGEIQS